MQENAELMRAFYGKTVVIKYGGSAIKSNGQDDSVIKDIAAMKRAGVQVVVVHGGGAEINALLKRVNKQPRFKEGLRVTDGEVMEIVEMALCGKVNREIVRDLQKQGVLAVGISGKDGRTITARKLLVNGQDVGFVGEAQSVETRLITLMSESGYIPVVAPVAQDRDGNSYNINADYAAAAVAGALKADRLVFITDVKGVLRDVNDESSLIPAITVAEAEELVKNGTVSGGMIPKVNCCIEGVKRGVRVVHILDAQGGGSIIPAIFADFAEKGVGTRVYL